MRKVNMYSKASRATQRSNSLVNGIIFLIIMAISLIIVDWWGGKYQVHRGEVLGVERVPVLVGKIIVFTPMVNIVDLDDEGIIRQVEINDAQYDSLTVGQSVNIEMMRGIITGFSYGTALK